MNISKQLQRKIDYSINLLQKAEKIAISYDHENGFFLAFSGGKDSQALYQVAKLAGVKFKAHMNLTSVDPPEVIRFVKQHYQDVELVAPKKSIYQIAKEKGMPPTMKKRWCCAEYKEGAGAGKVTLIGIRHEESSRRKKRNEVEISGRKYSGDLDGLDNYRKERNIMNADKEQTLGCIRGKETLLISPIIHWTVKDVWEFLNAYNLPHCKLYDEGWRRIGCLCCPMSGIKQKRKELARYPHLRSRWVDVFENFQKTGQADLAMKYNCSADDMFEWWISGKNFRDWYMDYKLQTRLFNE